MKWLGWVLSVIVTVILVMACAAMRGPLILLIPLYGGLFIYWAFRPTWNDRLPAIKKIVIIGLILTVILIIESILLQNMADRLQELQNEANAAPLGGAEIVGMFANPSLLLVIGLGLVFILVPVLLAFLDGLTKPDAEGLVRNPVLVLVYMLLTLGIYAIYWLWLTKKGLAKSNIQTRSLWWLLLPIVGGILVIIDFSKALEQRTKRKFATWFLIFFFVRGIDIPIIQAIINHDLSEQKMNVPDGKAL